jgi:phenylpropionate dioxygenase-like ring-hydroxylating dioxygenase large terminal subunit
MVYRCGKSEPLTMGVIHAQIIGEEIVLFRDENGVAHALNDRCPHRGARLSLGTTKNGRLACPFHGWKIDGSGSCCSIPANGPRAPIPAAAVVTSYPVTEHGVISCSTLKRSTNATVS